MKQILPLMAALCLLTGCAAQSAPSVPASTAPPPTAAPQTLTVYADAAALPALQAYADARGVSLTTTQDAESADLAVLDAPPAGEGWRDLLGDELLSAAASRAGVTEGPCYALPLGDTLYAYWADGTALTALLGDNAVTDLQNASWEEWQAFAEAFTDWVQDPGVTKVTLSGAVHSLPETMPEGLTLDGLFAAALGAGALWLGLVVGGGELRLYMLTGMALGAALWFCLPSRLLRPVWDFWIAALLALCRLLWIPFAFVGCRLKKLAALAKKGFSFLEKCATMKVDAWKSHHTPEETPQKKGGRAMARTKNNKRAKKRPHTAMLLVIVALVAVLGVQIVRVYGQLKAARQTEDALDQQLTQQQQENDALRSDLARKDDESFIKALARDLLGLAEEGERIFYDVND